MVFITRLRDLDRDRGCAAARRDCGRIWIGGFSLGGRMAAEAALRAPAGCVLGGVLVLSGGGAQELALPSGSAPGSLSILVTHGRSDRVVPFDQGEAFARKLVAAGHRVRWLAFDGGHALGPVVADVARFLDGQEVGIDGATL